MPGGAAGAVVAGSGAGLGGEGVDVTLGGTAFGLGLGDCGLTVEVTAGVLTAAVGTGEDVVSSSPQARRTSRDDISKRQMTE